jgi:hypothetical protein
MLKAESLLSLISDVKPGKYITWPIYDGNEVLDAKTVEDYVTVFFKTGSIMPIPVLNLGLDIHAMATDYDDDHNRYKITIEGFVTKSPGIYQVGEIKEKR